MDKKKRAMEDYLEVIYLLELKNKRIRLTDIAKMLDVTPASVSEYMNKLEKEGYINKEKYGDIFLTDKGRDKAVEILNRHGVIYSFLKDILGVSEEIAEKEACELEHILSEETFKKIKDRIIDDAGETMTLYDANGKVKVISIEGGRQSLLKLYSLGIKEGEIVEVKRRGPMHGPVVVNINGRDVAIGRGMALRVIVRKV